MILCESSPNNLGELRDVKKDCSKALMVHGTCTFEIQTKRRERKSSESNSEFD